MLFVDKPVRKLWKVSCFDGLFVFSLGNNFGLCIYAKQTNIEGKES